jgi:hypothetical protein
MKRQSIILFFALSFLFNNSFGQTSTSCLTPSTKKLLTQPFDLHSFKKKKGQSNSGGPGNTKNFLKPGKGVYWSFFLFRPMEGYLGTDTLNRIHTEKGVDIITFQPVDEYQNKYFNPNETLIQVTAFYNDFDLPELAFVGLDTKTVEKKLGASILQKNGCLIYFDGHNILTLHAIKGKVDWLKYTRLKFTLTKDNIPNELLTDKVQ